MKEPKIKIGISVGDLNGIGLEVILKTIEDNRISELCTPIIFGAKKEINSLLKELNIQNVQLNYTDSLNKLKNNQANVYTTWTKEVNVRFGEEDKQVGAIAFLSLQTATEAIKKGTIDALLTAPINKQAIQSSDFEFPGHTEYLQQMDGQEDSLMLMLGDSVKIGVVTGHIPLKQVPKALTSELILKKITILNKSLKEDFNVRKPKIAVMGLNPHAGDNGLLGKEEKEFIIPAINQAKSIGILAYGPYAADGFFGASSFRQFDAVLAMYHDQGLIPAKSFSFGDGVNFTAGLSFVRTSPDHGTAYEIAGKGLADESSFRKALYEAIAIVRNRRHNWQIEQEALPVNKVRN